MPIVDVRVICAGANVVNSAFGVLRLNFNLMVVEREAASGSAQLYVHPR